MDGLVRLMNREDITGPVNIGNPIENTVYELAEIVSGILGSQLHVSNEPLPTNDPQRRRPNITLANTLLGWEPKVPLSLSLCLYAPSLYHFYIYLFNNFYFLSNEKRFY